MPTYDYRCPDGHEFEKFYRKISDSVAELPCPECGKLATRLVSGGAVHFKGSGFYLTDYGKNAHRNAAPSSSGGEGKETKGSESTSSGASEGTSSETKPAESKPTETKPTSDSKATKKSSSSGTPKSGT